MTIRGVPGSVHQVTSARAAYEVAALGRRSSARSTGALTADATATSVRISDRAELLHKLRLLHDARPKEFKRLVGEMANDVRAAADGAANQALFSEVAERFEQAALDGNLTPIVPPIETTARARVQFQQRADALSAPSEGLRELFRGFVAKVNAVLPGSENPAFARLR